MLLASIKEEEGVALDNDYVATGYKTLESDIYPVKVTMAYISQSKGGANALNFEGVTPTGAKVSNQFWITSGKAKGQLTSFVDRDGVKQPLPGFAMANSLALLTLGKKLLELDSEIKVVKLYDYAEKKDLPTEVEMITDLIGQEIYAGIVKQVVSKQAKDATGNYVPTAETREQNEIVKFFRASDKMTVVEIAAKATEPNYFDVWTEQNQGKVQDKTSVAATGATAGAPAKAAPASGVKSLFN